MWLRKDRTFNWLEANWAYSRIHSYAVTRMWSNTEWKLYNVQIHVKTYKEEPSVTEEIITNEKGEEETKEETKEVIIENLINDHTYYFDNIRENKINFKDLYAKLLEHNVFDWAESLN